MSEGDGGRFALNAFVHEPLVLGLFLAQIVTLVVFTHQGAVNALLYHSTRRLELRTYAVWCVCSALFVLCFLLLKFRLPVVVYEQSLHWMSIFGAFGMAYYLAALCRYLGIENRWLDRLIAWHPLAAIWPLASSFDLALGGSGFFLRVRTEAPESLIVQLADSIVPRNEVHPAFHAVVAAFVVADLALLVHGIYRARRRDPWIVLGVGITCCAILFEITALKMGYRYAVPVLFAANLVEVLRITYMAMFSVGREVVALERAVVDQERVIQDQMDALEAGEALRELGQRAAMVGHEMRNPVASATLFVSAARRGLAEGAPVAPMLEKVGLALRQLSDVLASMTPQARDPSGTTRLEDAIARAKLLCTARIESVGASVDIAVPCECVVRARPASLTQIFVNLIANACDAVEARPHRTIAVRADEQDDRVDVRVMNPGRVPSQIASRMFEPGSSTRGESRGQGLGISRRVVTELGGSLRFVPSGDVTCFVVSLPTVVETAEHERDQRCA